MAKKRTSRKKAAHPAKIQQDGEIRRARRAVSAASSGQAQALSIATGKTFSGSGKKKPTSAPPANNLEDQTQQSSPPSPGEPSTAGVGGVMKGLLRAAAGLVAGDPKPQSGAVQPRATAEPLLNLPCNPLTDLARRHASRVGQSPTDYYSRLDQHSDRMLAGLARAQLEACIDESERTTTPKWPNSSNDFE